MSTPAMQSRHPLAERINLPVATVTKAFAAQPHPPVIDPLATYLPQDVPSI